MADWPDWIIGGIAVFFAWRGWHNGFVAELAGPVAVIVAAYAAFRYPGFFDDGVAAWTHLGPGSAHAVGTVIFAVVIYALLNLIAWLLSRIAKLPVLGIANAAGGAVLGVGKTLIGAWLVLYIALFFPLTPDLRDDLHRAALVQLVTAPNAALDADERAIIPWFLRPLLEPFFGRHHV